MHLKLIDFGAGKYYLNKEMDKADDEIQQPESDNFKGLKRLGTFIGTYEYMAPEVILGTSSDNSCDLWSIGIILYKFFAEFSPFAGGFAEETLAKIQEEDIEFPEEFPDEAKDLCLRLLEKDPRKRLGAGLPGSENDMIALKSHPFFKGIDFDNISKLDSPIPNLNKRKATIKEEIIAKYKKTTETNLINTDQLVGKYEEPVASEHKAKIEDWRFERKIKIIHKELISCRTKMIFIYEPIIALVTDEPAFYLYHLKTGKFKRRYDLRNCYCRLDGKTKFKIIMKGEKEYKKITNKFKIKQEKKDRGSPLKKNIIEIIKELCLK